MRSLQDSAKKCKRLIAFACEQFAFKIIIFFSRTTAFLDKARVALENVLAPFEKLALADEFDMEVLSAVVKKYHEQLPRMSSLKSMVCYMSHVICGVYSSFILHAIMKQCLYVRDIELICLWYIIFLTWDTFCCMFSLYTMFTFYQSYLKLLRAPALEASYTILRFSADTIIILLNHLTRTTSFRRSFMLFFRVHIIWCLYFVTYCISALILTSSKALLTRNF